MIKDKLQNAHLYTSIHPLFKKAFEYIHNTNLNELENGKHLLDGENLFALMQEFETKPTEGAQSEAHLKYIDIQYVISGKELMGHTTRYNQEESKVYDQEMDYALFNEKVDFITVNEGEFIIFFPDDIHMPCIQDAAPKTVKKIVFKVNKGQADRD